MLRPKLPESMKAYEDIVSYNESNINQVGYPNINIIYKFKTR